MKKTIKMLSITLAAICVYTGLKAQTQPAKPVSEKHPGYSFDGSKPVTFTVTNTFTIPAGLINDYFYILGAGGIDAIQNGDLPGKQIQAYLRSYNIINSQFKPIIDSLNKTMGRALNDFVKKDQERFTADTLKLYHPDTVKKKKKGGKQ